MESRLTEYTKYCLLCGSPTNTTHHLCYGGANRKLSDEDGLTIPVCRPCHDEIHKCGVAGKMSRIIGQLVYEREIGTREEFRNRYGKSWI